MVDVKDAKLVLPSEKYLSSYLLACMEFKKNGVSMFILHDPDGFDRWQHTIFVQFEKQRLGIDLIPGYVPSTTFWLVENDEYIGTGNIRHRLTESLEKFGGHIGYAIRASKWNHGYGTLLLKFLLKEANQLGINPALITCDLENIASAKVIEKNGGKRMDVIPSILDGPSKMICRYWVDTSQPANSSPP